ncbi:MAG: glycosyltransferase family 2 protein [Shimia sp.]
MTSLSVLTIAKGRADHLERTLIGCAAQTRQPTEAIVVRMQAEPYTLPALPFPVRQVEVLGDELPLAQARNRAAAEAVGDQLVFLDVDCIPGPDALSDYAKHTTPENGVLMGEVGYLPKTAVSGGIDYALFERAAERHPDRQGPPPEGLRPCNDYRCFWSLNFALHRETWDRIGGFDERYVGYGAEDTDFGRTVDAKGVPIHWMKGGKVYHQYHPHCMPPVHHIASILRNAEVFRAKWGHRTMEHWLHAFHVMGLIEKTDDTLRQVREPNEEDLALCRQEADQPFATTRAVLDYLAGMSGAEGHTRARAAEVERQQAAFLAAE